MKKNKLNLPITLQVLKDIFDEEADNSKCRCNPEYDLLNYLSELFGKDLLKESHEILVMSCPKCGHWTYYDGGFTDTCKCCGYYNIADYSDDAITLDDYYSIDTN